MGGSLLNSRDCAKQLFIKRAIKSFATASGVLTAYPNITANLVTPGFALKTLNFTLTDDGDSRGPLLEMFAEVENTGTTTECTFLPQIMLELDEIVSLLETPPYYGDIVNTVTSDCLGPGDVGVLPGVARGVTAAELAASGTLTIDVGPNTYGTNTPATDGPTITGMVSQVGTGWGLSGQILLRSTIHNYGMRVYPRDNRGVLVDELLAFPGTLETLTAGSTVDFETEGSTCHFAEYVLFDSWIVGP